jgi:hypothetical protein
VRSGSAWASRRVLTSAAPSGGATTTTSETARDAARARIAWISMGVPFSARSALGAPGPRRTPRPAAGITAATEDCACEERESSDIGSCQVCVLDLRGYGLRSAGRDALTGPFRDTGRASCPGPAHHYRGMSLRRSTESESQVSEVRVSESRRSPESGSESRKIPPNMPKRPATRELSSGTTAFQCAEQGVPVACVRTREPRRAGPRPCPRSCSPRARAHSPGSGEPWRACASHLRTVRARAHDATGHGRLPRP